MDHNRSTVTLLLIALLTLNLHSPLIGAAGSEDSESDHDEYTGSHPWTQGDSIPWNDYLRECVVDIWDRNDPKTQGHAQRMHNDWAKQFPQYSSVSKNSLRQAVLHMSEEGKIPLNTDEQVRKQEARIKYLDPIKRQKWPPEFKTDFDNFLITVPEKFMWPREIRRLFLNEYPQYNHLNAKAVSKYIRNQRWYKEVSNKAPRGQRESYGILDRMPWNSRNFQELMDIWDETFSTGSRSEHGDRILKEWKALHPRDTQATALYLKRRADSLIVANTKDRIQKGENNQLIRKRLQFMYLRGERIEKLHGINENLLKYWNKVKDVLHAERAKEFSRGKLKITHVKHADVHSFGSYTGTEGSSSRTSYDQAPPRSSDEDPNASSSQISNPEAEFQKQVDPYQPQPNYVHYIQSGIFVPSLRIPQHPETHQFLNQSQHEEPHHFHGESSSRISRSHYKRSGTPRLNEQSSEHHQRFWHSRGDGSKASSSRGHNDNLDLDLHL